mmetsp:Transcript_16988/g.44944  ORF Transcript_16988/g.44944 Transcript_16988/m.44944 type:complete len:309 (-) Transcript_16988:100-1026(-)
MFDFGNLDDVDDDGAPPEWLKWQGVPEWQRAAKNDLTVLEDGPEEHFAASDEDYVYEKLEVPFLPEEDAYDPMGLYFDSTDAIEDKMATYNGQVLMQYVVSTYEGHMMAEIDKQARNEYIESIHQERLAVLDSRVSKMSQIVKVHKETTGKFDRKSFGWREIQTPLMGGMVGLPDGGVFAESSIMGTANFSKFFTKVKGTVFAPTASLIQVLCAVGHIARPAPSGPRITRNAEWHIALTDVFFPSPFIVDNGSEYVGKKKEEDDPTFVHLVVMSINKETGAIEAKNILENIKLQAPTNYPPRRSLGAN